MRDNCLSQADVLEGRAHNWPCAKRNCGPSMFGSTPRSQSFARMALDLIGGSARFRIRVPANALYRFEYGAFVAHQLNLAVSGDVLGALRPR